jgi:hypothetical protein
MHIFDKNINDFSKFDVIFAEINENCEGVGGMNEKNQTILKRC